MSDINELTDGDASAKGGLAVVVFASYLFVAQILLVNLLIVRVAPGGEQHASARPRARFRAHAAVKRSGAMRWSRCALIPAPSAPSAHPAPGGLAPRR